ncbi:hypothetical protein [Hyphomicrobium sp. 99]|uniref:hypothetical protein n=1 Tax=Hyphomicrobium sp. 99 TaxID=1163419 RepID=UPI0005F811C0|nr:hypothetical protein [Hyphomicrobium sp. 99]
MLAQKRTENYAPPRPLLLPELIQAQDLGAAFGDGFLRGEFFQPSAIHPSVHCGTKSEARIQAQRSKFI